MVCEQFAYFVVCLDVSYGIGSSGLAYGILIDGTGLCIYSGMTGSSCSMGMACFVVSDISFWPKAVAQSIVVAMNARLVLVVICVMVNVMI